MPTEIGTVKVLTGSKVVGRYKRSMREAITVKMSVDRTLVVPDQYGELHPYIAGTRLDGAHAGRIQALRADCLFPTQLEVSEDTDFVPLEREGWYVNPNNDPMFGFFEHLGDAIDIDEDLDRGAKPSADYEVKYLDVPIATQGGDEPLEIVVDADTALMILDAQVTAAVEAAA